MVRSLWTAASGMITQQMNVDNISNNIANINTMGYKKQQTEFKSLLYQTIQQKTTDNQGNPKPVSAQVGSGVRASAMTTIFEQGTLTGTQNAMDFAIEGDGFFMVQKQDGSTAYTRSGDFSIGVTEQGSAIIDSEGNYLLDSNKNPIVFDASINVSKMVVDDNGYIGAKNAEGELGLLGVKIGLAQFNNPAGLEKTSNSMYVESAASGAPIIEGVGNVQTSKIKQGYLEGSNVQSVDEMVNLIVAQRAYEMNSKAITAADTMLQQANNLRG